MNLLNHAIPAAVTGAINPGTRFNASPLKLTVQANFKAGSGGTSYDAYLQTSLDGGATWVDIANFHFTTSDAKALYNFSGQTPKTTAVTPTDGSLAANTSVDGILGPMYRVKETVVGSYSAAAAIAIDLTTDKDA